MKISRIVLVLMVVACGSLMLMGQAQTQTQPGEGGRQRGGDPQERRERMEQFRQQMSERMREQMGATAEEWTILSPKIEKVTTLAMQSRFGGMGMGMGGRGRGNRGQRDGQGDGQRDRDENADRPQSELEKASTTLRTTLENKEASPDQITAAMDGLRQARAKAQTELEAAQKDLREILTVRQEAQLVLMGVLN